MTVFTFRSIEAWPGERTRNRQGSRFKANYSRTLQLLERELAHLRARNVVIEADADPSEIRLDGQLRANARLRGPGIILSFDSKFGPLRYPCDTFTTWQDNLRGIALALEHLRAVDRYGVTRRGEQYTGWSKLPPGGSMTVAMTTEQAATFMDEHDPTGEGWTEDILHDVDFYRAIYRNVARALHPDTGGTTEDFQKLQEAKRVLDRHHGLNGAHA